MAADGRTAPELQAKSRHQHLASLGRYVRLGEQTSARVTAEADPASAWSRSSSTDYATAPVRASLAPEVAHGPVHSFPRYGRSASMNDNGNPGP
jgi:hypothetical protein